MILLNIKKLETQLIKNELSEKATFQYLLVYLIFLALAVSLPDMEGYSQWGWDITDLACGLLITIGGTYIAFSINSKGSDRDFLKRYLSLSFVHSFRLVLLLLTLQLIYKIVMFVIPLDLWYFFNDLFTGDAAELLYSVIISLSFYLLLIRSFKIVNGTGSKVESEYAPQYSTKEL